MSPPANSENSLRAGRVTTLPLVCFAAAANRLPLSMIGILYYLALALFS